jgi:hypothetical protein
LTGYLGVFCIFKFASKMSIEKFLTGSEQVGFEMIRFEVEKFGLGDGVDVDNLIKRIGEIGASMGLEEKTQTRASVQGANAARGARNERVNGLKIKSW